MKQYVLLEDKRIIDTSKNGFWRKEVIEESDNLIDLLEVGDFIELDNEWEILKILRFNKNNEIVCMVRTSSNTEEYVLHDYRKKYIIAIWKRNGDIMRRYEICPSK